MSPRSLLSNQKIRDERREAILRAALQVFAYQGLKAARIADIAAQAGISQGLVHHYFASKEDVYVAVVEHAMAGALAAFDDLQTDSLSPWGRLERITGRMLQGITVHPEYMLVLVQSLVNQETPPQTGKLLAETGRQFSDHLVELIRAGQAANEVVQGDPQELALVFLAAVQGLAITHFTGGMFIQGGPTPAGPSLPVPATLLRLLKA